MKFNSSEQAFQHAKAIACKREDTAHDILQLSDPKDIKQKGDKIHPTTKEWESGKVSKMEEIIYHKFAQNKDLGRKLCDTGTLPLYESTANQFWGCGLRLNSKQWFTGIYPGKNIMGQLLMKIRTRLMERHQSKSTVASAQGSSTQLNATQTCSQAQSTDSQSYPSLAQDDMDTSSRTRRPTEQTNLIENPAI